MFDQNKHHDLLIFLAVTLNLLGLFAITIAMDPSRTGNALIALLLAWVCINQIWRFVSQIQGSIHDKWRHIFNLIIKFNRIEIRKYIMITICYFAILLSKSYIGTDLEMFTIFIAAMAYLATCLLVLIFLIQQAKILIVLSKRFALWLYFQIKYANLL